MNRIMQAGVCAIALLGLVGCHHHKRCHDFESETTVYTKQTVRVSEHSSCGKQPPCMGQPAPVLVPAPAPFMEPSCVVQPAPMPVCPPPISIYVQDEICESVPVCVPVYRTVWEPSRCCYVQIIVGHRNEFRMERRFEHRYVYAHWSAHHGCYGWIDRRGCWRAHHGR